MFLAERRQVLYSGMLPIAEQYRLYDERTRERMCRWNDAFTVDESARQSKLVENEIKQQDRASWMTFFLMIVFSAFSLICFLITRDAASFLFLSVPVANVIGSLLKPVFSRSSRSK